MILSGQSIEDRNMIRPFSPRQKVHGMTYGLGTAGYDVRLAQDIMLGAGAFALGSTVEEFMMPDDVLGMVADKSTWARQGIAVQNTIIEPGWYGFLTLELTNHGKHLVYLKAGMPIAQIIFHLLDRPTNRPYEGKYQGQPARPVEAILDWVE
jgi:dCTP deaminase